MPMLPLVFIAAASSHDFVAHVTRLGGDSATAQPFIDKFCRYVETKMGWPASSVTGKFIPAKAEAKTYIDTQKPAFGMLEPALYTEMKVEPIVTVQSKELAFNKLHVVTKAASLDALKGKTLCALGADSPAYLSKYVFAGKIDAAKHFQLKPMSALKAMRSVIKGECDATLLDDEMLASASKVEGGAELKSVHASGELPPPQLVTIGKSVTPAEKTKLASVLTAMCDDAEGKAICTDMRVEKFVKK